jgi:glucokinase
MTELDVPLILASMIVMGKIYTISASEIRESNRSSILNMVRCNGPISRIQISEYLQVNLPTVMQIVDELILDNLITEIDEKKWSGGCKRTRLIFNGSEHLVIGIDLGGTKIYGAVADFNGEIHHEVQHDHHETKANESLELVFNVIDQCLVYVQKMDLPVRGIGIGVPGVVQPDTGIVTIAPALDWVNYPLKDHLVARYSYPIAIENDVNLAALGEMWFGTTGDEVNMVLLTIGTGIGAGIIINGTIYGGSHNMAGEVGYFLPDRSYLGQQFSGFGALEKLASGLGIARRARQALEGCRSQEELESLTAYDVFDAVRRKETWTINVFNETVAYLAQLIAALLVIIDPDVVILGGGVSKSADLLIEPICNLLNGTLLTVPSLRASKLGYRAGVMGAIIRLMRISSNYYSLHKFS